MTINILPPPGATGSDGYDGLPNRKVYDIRDGRYGRPPQRDASNDASANILRAIDEATQNNAGGIVYAPGGSYRLDKRVTVPVMLDRTVELVGDGKRGTYFYPNVPGDIGVLFGSDTPDASGASTKVTQYCGMRGISFNGALLKAANVTSIAVQMTEAQRCWYEHGIVEGYDFASSMGLYLRGSTTVGVGNPASPHVWRCRFPFLTIVTCMRPVVLENVDESEFPSLICGLPPGVTAGADSLVAWEIIQGHNNRGFGVLLSGENTDLAKRAAYVGVKFSQPTKGDVLGNVITGLVAEGFDKPIIFGGNLAVANGVRDYDSSINASDFTDLAPQVGSRCFVDAPLHGYNYRNSVSQYTDALSFADRDTNPSVSGGDTYACVNTGATTIVGFANGHNGQVIYVRQDLVTTFQTGGNIRTNSGANIPPGANNRMLVFVNIGGAQWVGGLLS